MIGIAAAPKRRSRTAAPESLRGLLSLFESPGFDEPAPPHRTLAVGTAALVDLGEALSEFARGEAPRGTVRVRAEGEACEIGLERARTGVLVSVYTSGALPVVHAHQLPVDPRRVAERILSELRERATGVAERDQERIDTVMAGLAELPAFANQPDDDCSPVQIESPEELSFSFSAEVSMSPGSGSSHRPGAPTVLRADLLPLLLRGRLRVSVLGHARELFDVHVFLVAEQLADLALQALEAHFARRPILRRVEVGGAICGFRLIERRAKEPLEAALTLGRSHDLPGPRTESWTFPSLDVGAFARAVVDFGRALGRGIVRRDRSQTHNLRLVEFRGKIREIAEACREVERDDTLVNASPESYRAYATSSPEASTVTSSGRSSEGAALAASPGSADLGRTRLRFSPKWTAAVPAIDLRSTFQCGDSFIVGSARDLMCLDRRTGTLTWTRPLAKGVSVLTPCGIARIDPDGQLTLIDLATGRTRASVRLAPRAGAPITGAVIGGRGLPRLLIVSEGRRHLAAVDLEVGDVRWRHAARRPGAFRLRRAGRLVVVASGERALYALDVVTGEVVWRFIDRLRFASAPTLADDSLFVVAGDGAFVGKGGARLFHLDPWSGEPRWSVDLPPDARPVGSPLSARDTVLMMVLGRRGTSIAAFDRRTGEPKFSREACAGVAAALVVDDVVVLNSESGDVVGLDAQDGTLRYRHQFGSGVDGDRPRRLEPVLRSGALFVPQSSVHVLRPGDGTILGTVTQELIPDLLRVDERCDVYVAEESGHVAAFGRAAQLSLVKG